MKLNWRTELPQWAIIAAMFALAAMSWSLQPVAGWTVQMPPGIHILPEGAAIHAIPDGGGTTVNGRFALLFALPASAVVVYLALIIAPLIDPGRANYAQFSTAFTTFRIAIVALLAAIYSLIHLQLRGFRFDMGAATARAVGVLLIVIGNLLGKVRPNWFVGIRTPWTMSSKISWNKTHRLGGYVLIAIGLLQMLGTAIFGQRSLVVVAPIIGLLAVVLVAYSYFIWRADPDKIPPVGTLPAQEH